jgi:uncharacterized membrane protein
LEIEGDPVTTKVEKTVLVNVPVSRAYQQWTQFEEFPRFMGGVTSVTQLSDNRLQWVAEIAGQDGEDVVVVDAVEEPVAQVDPTDVSPMVRDTGTL